LWTPDLIDQNNYQKWKKEGSKALGQRASEKVEGILASHTPEPLPKGIQSEIHDIVRGLKEAS